MPTFFYQGRDGSGNAIKGMIESASNRTVADQLMGAGIIPVHIEETQIRPAGMQLAGRVERFFRHVSQDRLMLFCRQMYSMLKSGLPIMRALECLETANRRHSLGKIIGDIRADLDRGIDVTSALRQHPRTFSPFFTSMVHAGEQTGTLDEAFFSLFGHIEFDKRTRDSIKSALRYPAFVLFGLAAAIVLVNLFVIPQFAHLFKRMNTELPHMTQLMIRFSEFMVHYWPWLIGGAAGLAVAAQVFVRTRRGKLLWDRFKLKIPIVGKIIYYATLSRFSRSLATTTRSGVPIMQGLGIVGQVVDNEYVKQKIDRMIEIVQNGENLSRAASAVGIFDPVTLQMISIGEETGDIDGLLFEVSGMFDREVEYNIKNLSQQIEPLLIIVMAVFVGMFALAVLLPIWDYSSAALRRK